MFILREKYVVHICLIVFILIQTFGFNAVHGLDCVQCNITSCKDDLSVKPTPCTDGASTKCFTKIDDSGKIIRGCLTAAEEPNCKPDNKCIATNDKSNTQLVCKSCLATDADCSQTDVSDKKYNKICDAGISKCIKKINDKLVVRDCASQTDVTQCTDKNTCETCEGINCNSGIFPKNRLSCYQCSGDKCNDVAANNLKSKPCLLSDDKDECYTKGENDTNITRGCKSDTKENQCSTAAAGCAFCNTADCNKLKYKEKPTLKCYQCTGEKNDDCFKSQNETTLKLCQQDVLYDANQYCYTKYEGEKIERGCLNDNSKLSADTCNDTAGGACSKCTGDACNGKLDDFTCVVCRDDEQPGCLNEATKLPGKTCRNQNNTVTDGCFYGIWHDVIIRGCTLDLTVPNQELCKSKNNANKCEICNTKNCNTKALSSASVKNSLSLGLLSVVLMILWKY